MDERSKEILAEILQKAPEDLTDEEARFLRARRDYLKKGQKEEFKNIINPPEPKKAAKEEKKEGNKEEAPLYVAKKDQTSETETVKQNDQESQ